jgi:3,4-dihydroxy 2-butanone 4-phosphate synthase / GTP cyclohydrolase II
MREPSSALVTEPQDTEVAFAMSRGYKTHAKVDELISEARNGRAIILVDDLSSPPSGAFIVLAQFATPGAINLMARNGRGLICLAIQTARLRALRLGQIPHQSGSPLSPDFAVSIDAKEGITTGISSADRARTIAVAIDASRGPEMIVTPGHVFPVGAKEGGALERPGFAEVGVDLARLAGVNASAVYCTVLDDRGDVAGPDQLERLATGLGLRIGSFSDLLAYRMRHDPTLSVISESEFVAPSGLKWSLSEFVGPKDKVCWALEHRCRRRCRSALLAVQRAPLLQELVFDKLRAEALMRSMTSVEIHGSGTVIVLPAAGAGAGEEIALEQSELLTCAQILTSNGWEGIRFHCDERLEALTSFGIKANAGRAPFWPAVGARTEADETFGIDFRADEKDLRGPQGEGLWLQA